MDNIAILDSNLILLESFDNNDIKKLVLECDLLNDSEYLSYADQRYNFSKSEEFFTPTFNYQKGIDLLYKSINLPNEVKSKLYNIEVNYIKCNSHINLENFKYFANNFELYIFYNSSLPLCIFEGFLANLKSNEKIKGIIKICEKWKDNFELEYNILLNKINTTSNIKFFTFNETIRFKVRNTNTKVLPKKSHTIINSFTKEKILYENKLSNLNLLRNHLKIDSRKQNDTEEIVWYNIGYECLGPLFTGFIESIVKYCKENKIETVFPLMREGEFLSHLLEKDLQKLNVHLIPFFVSRSSSFFFNRRSFSDKELKNFFRQPNLTVNEFITFLNLESLIPKWLITYLDAKLKDTYKIFFKKISLKSRIVDFINSKDCLEYIRNYSLKQTSLFLKYLKHNLKGKNILFIDIGFKGSICESIESTIDRTRLNTHYFLLYGVKTELFSKRKSKIKISSYIEIDQDNHESNIIYRTASLIEQFNTSTSFGTTIRYKTNKRNLVEPVTINSHLSINEMKMRNKLWTGVIDFRNSFNTLINFRNQFSKIESFIQKEHLSCFLGRLIRWPSKNEIRFLKKLKHEENLGNNTPLKIYKENVYNRLNKKNITDFLNNPNPAVIGEFIHWPQLYISIKYPYYLPFLYTQVFSKNYIYYKIIKFEYLIKKSKIKDFILYGCSYYGSILLNILREQNKNIVTVIDSDCKLVGSDFFGHEVKSSSAFSKHDFKGVAIGSLGNIEEIKAILSKHFPSKYSLISFY